MHNPGSSAYIQSVRSAMIVYLLLVACSHTREDTAAMVACAEGFGMAADGLCYELAAEDTAAPAWGYVEGICDGEGTYPTITLETPGPVVSMWGFYTPERLAVCASYPQECPGIDEGANGEPVDVLAVTPTGVTFRCEWFELTGQVDGEPATWTGYYQSPIRAYYLTP